MQVKPFPILHALTYIVHPYLFSHSNYLRITIYMCASAVSTLSYTYFDAIKLITQ